MSNEKNEKTVTVKYGMLNLTDEKYTDFINGKEIKILDNLTCLFNKDLNTITVIKVNENGLRSMSGARVETVTKEVVNNVLNRLIG